MGAIHGTAEQYPVKLPKKDKRVEDRTVFVLSCDGKYALEKRPDQGLLAGLWQFPNVSGKLEAVEALCQTETWGLRPRDIRKTIERKHIFTHIRWEMRGVYLEVSEPTGNFVWLTGAQIDQEAALPTAFRQFWEEAEEDV